MNIVRRKNEFHRFSLHDCFITGITTNDNNVEFAFKEGIYNLKGEEDVELSPATIIFTDVDYDFSDVYLLKNNGGMKKRFRGRRYSLKKFSKKLRKAKLEIIDETYDTYQMTWRGFYYKKNKIHEFLISITYTGQMIYSLDEKE